jgi:hypothetical protein
VRGRSHGFLFEVSPEWGEINKKPLKIVLGLQSLNRFATKHRERGMSKVVR